MLVQSISDTMCASALTLGILLELICRHTLRRGNCALHGAFPCSCTATSSLSARAVQLESENGDSWRTHGLQIALSARLFFLSVEFHQLSALEIPAWTFAVSVDYPSAKLCIFAHQEHRPFQTQRVHFLGFQNVSKRSSPLL